MSREVRLRMRASRPVVEGGEWEPCSLLRLTQHLRPDEIPLADSFPWMLEWQHANAWQPGQTHRVVDWYSSILSGYYCDVLVPLEMFEMLSKPCDDKSNPPWYGASAFRFVEVEEGTYRLEVARGTAPMTPLAAIASS